MPLDRRYLIEQLELVAPALADNDLVPVLKYYMFTGKQLVAYNDRIALSTPMQTDFVGGLPGELLLKLLKESRDTNQNKGVDIKPEREHALILIGNSKIKLAMLPKDSFVFNMPKMPKENEIGVKPDDFVDGLNNCIRSISVYAPSPDQLGITAIPGRGALTLYATDRASISRAILKATGEGFPRRTILHSEFCKQAGKLGNGRGVARFAVRSDHIVMATDNISLYGKFLESSDPLDFEGVIDRLLPRNYKEGLVKMPKPTLGRILKRAAIITGIAGREAPTFMTVRNNVVTFESATERGKITDRAKLTGHADISTKFKASLLLRGYDDLESILLRDKVAIMAQKDMLYMVSSTAE